jgi:hypothetical protein
MAFDTGWFYINVGGCMFFRQVAPSKSDIPMPTGTVEKLFEPPASSFPPGGRCKTIFTQLEQSKIADYSNVLGSTKEAFGYFCLLTKVPRRKARRCETDFKSKRKE